MNRENREEINSLAKKLCNVCHHVRDYLEEKATNEELLDLIKLSAFYEPKDPNRFPCREYNHMTFYCVEVSLKSGLSEELPLFLGGDFSPQYRDFSLSKEAQRGSFSERPYIDYERVEMLGDITRGGSTPIEKSYISLERFIRDSRASNHILDSIMLNREFSEGFVDAMEAFVAEYPYLILIAEYCDQYSQEFSLSGNQWSSFDEMIEDSYDEEEIEEYDSIILKGVSKLGREINISPYEIMELKILGEKFFEYSKGLSAEPFTSQQSFLILEKDLLYLNDPTRREKSGIKRAKSARK